MNRQDMNRQGAKFAKTAKVAKAEPDNLTDELAHKVIGAAIEVHRHLGPGYLEGIYEEGLANESGLRGIQYGRQKTVAVDYKGCDIGQGRVDFVVGGAQVISYLKALSHALGLLINFNVPALRQGIQRVVLS